MIRWAAKHGAYIIEDDFNGELRYSSHPIPCVQYYDSEHTVYIGSFSKVLLPSVRISYMVLPESLRNASPTLIKSPQKPNSSRWRDISTRARWTRISAEQGVFTSKRAGRHLRV